MKNKRFASTRKISKKIEAKMGQSISHSSVRNYANLLNLHPYHHHRRPLLTAVHKANRVEYCLKMQGFQWTSCLFSDESWFLLYPRGNGQNDVIWTDDPTKVPALPQVRHSPMFLVWGAVSIHGNTDLFFFETTVKSKQYQECLEATLLPVAKKQLSKTQWHLVEDQAWPRKAKGTRSWLATNNVPSMMLPAKSPDINIIEKVWAIMKDFVSHQDPKNKEELKKAVVKAWKNISNDLVAKLIARIPGILDNIVLSGGSVID